MKITTFSCSTPDTAFDDWYTDTHKNGTAEWEDDDDVDEVISDSYNDKDES